MFFRVTSSDATSFLFWKEKHELILGKHGLILGLFLRGGRRMCCQTRCFPCFQHNMCVACSFLFQVRCATCVVFNVFNCWFCACCALWHARIPRIQCIFEYNASFIFLRWKMHFSWIRHALSCASIYYFSCMKCVVIMHEVCWRIQDSFAYVVFQLWHVWCMPACGCVCMLCVEGVLGFWCIGFAVGFAAVGFATVWFGAVGFAGIGFAAVGVVGYSVFLVGTVLGGDGCFVMLHEECVEKCFLEYKCFACVKWFVYVARVLCRRGHGVFQCLYCACKWCQCVLLVCCKGVLEKCELWCMYVFLL